MSGGIQTSVSSVEGFYFGVPALIEAYFRPSAGPVFGYLGIMTAVPYYSDDIVANLYSGVLGGFGFYIFDFRKENGVGWSMITGLSLGNYFNRDEYGLGLRGSARLYLGMARSLGFSIGADIEHVFFVTAQRRHTMNINYSLGLVVYP